MKGWTNDERMMIACCNDGTRPVIFKIERIDIPETDEEGEWQPHDMFVEEILKIKDKGQEELLCSEKCDVLSSKSAKNRVFGF